jgi:hypothetical protein
MKILLTILSYILVAYALAEIQAVLGIDAAWMAFGGIALLMAAIGIKHGGDNRKDI